MDEFEKIRIFFDRVWEQDDVRIESVAVQTHIVSLSRQDSAFAKRWRVDVFSQTAKRAERMTFEMSQKDAAFRWTLETIVAEVHES